MPSHSTSLQPRDITTPAWAPFRASDPTSASCWRVLTGARPGSGCLSAEAMLAAERWRALSGALLKCHPQTWLRRLCSQGSLRLIIKSHFSLLWSPAGTSLFWCSLSAWGPRPTCLLCSSPPWGALRAQQAPHLYSAGEALSVCPSGAGGAPGYAVSQGGSGALPAEWNPPGAPHIKETFLSSPKEEGREGTSGRLQES